MSPYPPADYADARQHLKELQEKGVIQESASQFASPIVLVRKKNGDLRLCIDYRKLNSRTIHDQYSIPKIEDTLLIRMCQPLFDRGHHIYMDNLFSSLELYIELAAHQIRACVTLRVNRIGTPDAIKATKMKKGDDLRSVRDGELLFLSWYNKWQVNIITSVHNASTFPKNVRARGQNEPRHVDKPVAIECYTKYMGGVDRADQGM